ncbi:MAG: LicD family protein [Clostridiales bacterium]|nr:LicD family protein [Clostridiales bacterium]
MERNNLSTRDIQLIEYNILCKVVDFLDNNELGYMLCGGTLLGAVRHGGFIPWDDDVDIFIPRNDYERLRTMVSSEPCCVNGVTFMIPGEEGGYHPFIKAVNTDYPCVEMNLEGIMQYIWVDIFPMDHYPEDERKHKSYVKKQIRLMNILLTGFLSSDYKKRVHKKNPLLFAKHFIGLILFKMMGGGKGVSRYSDKIAKRMNERYSSSHYVGDGTWPAGMKDYFDIDWIYPTTKLKFEDRLFTVPGNYDAYLTHFYGDYMTPPPENKRGGHSITVYRNEK